MMYPQKLLSLWVTSLVTFLIVWLLHSFLFLQERQDHLQFLLFLYQVQHHLLFLLLFKFFFDCELRDFVAADF
jgi:hypothetical protein